MLDRSDYLRVIQNLLPRGLVWRRDPGTVQSAVLDAIAAAPARIDLRADELLADAYPRTTSELLPEWEETVGLPDPCVGVQQTEQQRRQQVVARIAAQGGQSAAYYVSVLDALGFTATVEEFLPLYTGFAVGDAINGDAWAHAWRVSVADPFAVTPFRTGLSTAGESLAVWGDNGIACVLQRIKPAHSTVTVAFPAST